MRLHIVSDLHLEMRHIGQVLNQLSPGNADALVLAGDVMYLRFLDEVVGHFESFTKLYPKVFYVPGNHEYYSCKVDEAVNVLRTAEKQFPNLTVLRAGEVVEYGGHRFLGDTMWFPDDPLNAIFQSSIGDFHWIDGLVPWVYQENAKFADFLNRELRPGDVVVTHHLPASRCTPKRFKGSHLNRFFVCENSSLILDRKPALWLHGHTHDVVDFKLGKTRVFANPMGYPREPLNPNWAKRMVVDL